jgi:hypothetical protein
MTVLERITDFPQGWDQTPQNEQRSRWCCEKLEEGQILSFDGIPFDFPESDRSFLLSQQQSSSRFHKNISYRPRQDLLKGASSNGKEDAARLHQIMRQYSKEVIRFMTRLLAPYAAHWSLDFASFRPQEEAGRDLPLHKRNDLLHVDSFPTRPTHGARILRCFTNINPSKPRVWLTTDRFAALAENFAEKAGLVDLAKNGSKGGVSWLNALKKAVGLKGADRSVYDKLMLRFHDYLKENSDFQQNCPKIRLEFPSVSAWMCYTDAVPHAVLSGQYALEQTFIIPIKALVTPEKSPLRVLERIVGQPLAVAV